MLFTSPSLFWASFFPFLLLNYWGFFCRQQHISNHTPRALTVSFDPSLLSKGLFLHNWSRIVARKGCMLITLSVTVTLDACKRKKKISLLGLWVFYFELQWCMWSAWWFSCVSAFADKVNLLRNESPLVSCGQIELRSWQSRGGGGVIHCRSLAVVLRFISAWDNRAALDSYSFLYKDFSSLYLFLCTISLSPSFLQIKWGWNSFLRL